MLEIILSLFLATIGLIWYLNKEKKLKNGLKKIPGPKGLPILGNMLSLGKDQYKQFSKWAEQYGSIYQVNVGSFRQVIISDTKVCKEMLKDPRLNGRALAPEFDLWEDTPSLGIFNSEGDLWAIHRRFLLRQLRDFGFGKTSLESAIMEEVKELLQILRSRSDKPVGEIRETMRLAVVNALWFIMSSERFNQRDPDLLRLANNTSETFNKILENGGLIFIFPWVKHIIPDFSGYTAIRNVIEENREFFMKSIQNHKKNFREGEEHRDFIDAYLAEMKKNESDASSVFHGEIAERNLAAICFDMFFAGSDTTAVAISWTVFYMCKFPHCQKKLQQEISDVTGDSRHVSLTDRPNMPYTLALIDETLRLSSFVAVGAPHRVVTDMNFHGYYLPKDTLVQSSLFFIHHDPKIWGDPENYRPERFLSDDGKKYIKSDSLIPFQNGTNRNCLGEGLARDTIFLFLTNLFQQFSMKFDPTKPEPTFEPDVGLLLSPLPYKVILIDRITN